MQIKTEIKKTYAVEMSEEELNALYKFIGHTSTYDRMNKQNLTSEEDDIISDIFSTISEAKNHED